MLAMTDDELLRMALNGDETEWTHLHERCRIRTEAERLARLLERHADAGNDAAGAWAQVLVDLHPSLVVNLPPARPSP